MTKEKTMAKTMAEALEALDDDQKAATVLYNTVVQRFAEKIARKMAPPGIVGVRWEQGAQFLDQMAPAVVEELMKRFAGEMGLIEFVVFAASCAGYQAGVARAKGYELNDSVFEEAGRVFEAGMRLLAVSTEQLHRAGGVVAMVPGVPKGK